MNDETDELRQEVSELNRLNIGQRIGDLEQSNFQREQRIIELEEQAEQQRELNLSFEAKISILQSALRDLLATP